jgi:predicted  nucleic acid-binding Zn-ribbon protein
MNCQWGPLNQLSQEVAGDESATNMRLSQLAMAFRGHPRYRRRMEQDVREFLEQMAGMMAREFARINRRFDDVESRLDRVESRLDRVESRLDRVELRLDHVEAGLDRVEVRLDGIEARLDGIESRMESHDRRQDRLEALYLDMRREKKS